MQAFGRIGRWFLVVAVLAAIVAGVGAVTSTDALAGAAGSVALTFLVLGLTFVLVQRRLFGNPKALARVAAEGVPMNATITDVGPTSGRVNGAPIMRLGLNVNMQSVTLRSVVPPNKVHLVQVGALLPVRVDSGDPTLCVVDWASM